MLTILIPHSDFRRPSMEEPAPDQAPPTPLKEDQTWSFELLADPSHDDGGPLTFAADFVQHAPESQRVRTGSSSSSSSSSVPPPQSKFQPVGACGI
jgi:hypothetical protein